ncbi:MAG: chorismate synthase [Peptococcaceae bacterium]|nr:chorismate synthase [Peptococcaceae bacterium]
MGSVWGHKINISLFGESHGAAIGCVIDGLPSGLAIDFDAVDAQMARRAPGRSPLSTLRKETDRYEVLSGILNGKTTGAPLAVMIRNEDTKSQDYNPDILRPGHADYTAMTKYKGYADYRGGGHFSGRLTAPVVFAGAIVRQILAQQGIVIGARIYRIYDVTDEETAPDDVLDLLPDSFPVKNPEAKERMQQAILRAKSDGDSVGGIVECVAIHVPAGLGDPFFHSMESRLASLMFSIPAVKGVEFGDGFALAQMTGSQAGDGLSLQEGKICFASNHNGGINGGIANGQPLVCRVAVKPTPSIQKIQKTVNVMKGETVSVTVKGRHDPCIVPRALPVVEAMMAIGVYDFM